MKHDKLSWYTLYDITQKESCVITLFWQLVGYIETMHGFYINVKSLDLNCWIANRVTMFYKRCHPEVPLDFASNNLGCRLSKYIIYLQVNADFSCSFFTCFRNPHTLVSLGTYEIYFKQMSNKMRSSSSGMHSFYTKPFIFVVMVSLHAFDPTLLNSIVY